MNKKLSLLLILLLSGCSLTNQSNSESVNITDESLTNIPSESITESESTSSNFESIEESESESTSSNFESTDDSQSDSSSENKPNNNSKEYYKSLVDRDKIVYSLPLKNDPTHNVDKIEIFQINDTHGAYYEEDDIIGISRVYSVIKQNSFDPYGVVKIANGDMLQGTAFSNMLLGEPCIAALNEMNFDAFVIGNHEFDWGLDSLSVYKDGDESNGELKCEFLGANIVNSNNERPDWIKPYTIVEKGNVTVGIIGVVGDNLESSISKVSLGGYKFTSTVDAVEKYSKILKDQDVDVIIVGSHAHNEFANQQYVSNSLVDAIINAHDHYSIEETVTRYDGKVIPVIESYTKNKNIGKITLNLDANKKMQSYTMTHYYPSNFSKDSNLDKIMSVYHEVTNAYQNEVIGYKSGGFSKKDLSISTMNYIAEKYDADISMMNTGGVRAAITSSTITNSMVYEALPFDNELYMVTLSGDDFYKIVSKTGNYFNDTGIGNGTTVNLSKIDKSKTYKIVCVDYVATKSFYAQYFNEEHGLIKTGDYIRECAIENIIQNYKK